MNTYRVNASYMSYCYVDIQAESEDEAINLAGEMSVEDYTTDASGFDEAWEIDSAELLHPEDV
jgi:hypothetical protein